MGVVSLSESGHPISDPVSDCYDRDGDQDMLPYDFPGGFPLGLRHGVAQHGQYAQSPGHVDNDGARKWEKNNRHCKG